MQRTIRAILLAALMAAWVCSPASASPFNATAAFANPQAAPWSYGYSVGLPAAPFVAFTSFTSAYLGYTDLNAWYTNAPTGGFNLPAVLKNMTGGDLTYSTVTQPKTMLNLHPSVGSQPGVAEYSIVRFTAPASSLYAVDAFFQGLDIAGPTTTDVHVYLLVSGVMAGAINSYGPTGRLSYSGNLTMAAGGTLDFAVGPGSNGFSNDSTGFDATITAVPEPATLTLLGLGLAGVARAARRRKK